MSEGGFYEFIREHWQEFCEPEPWQPTIVGIYGRPVLVVAADGRSYQTVMFATYAEQWREWCDKLDAVEAAERMLK